MSGPRTLIVYYSLTGNVQFLAEQAAAEFDADLLRLEPVKEQAKGMVSKFLWSGKAIMMKQAPQLKPYSFNFGDYDLIILGTPVWAWTVTPAFRTFLNQEDLSGKKVALFCCHGGVKGKFFKRFRSYLPDSEIIDAIDFYEPLKHDKEAKQKQMTNWLSKVQDISFATEDK